MVGVDRLGSSVHSPDVSMSPKNDLIHIYEKKILSVTSQESRADGRYEVTRWIKSYLQSAEPKLRLPSSICDALEICVRSEDGVSWRPSKAVEALRAIESYVLNLWDYPWKKEFHVISTFSGYYKTRIEINIGLAADKLFALIGYRRVGAFLRLDVVPDRDQLRSAAAELMQGVVECEIQETILEVVHSYSVTASDVFTYRRSKPGSMADCIERLKRINSATHFVVEGDAGISAKMSYNKRENEALIKKEGGIYIGGGEGAHIGGGEGAHIGGGNLLSLQEDDIDHERQRENEERQFGSFADPPVLSPPPTTTQTTSRVMRPAPPPPPHGSGSNPPPHMSVGPPPPHGSVGSYQDANVVKEISSRGGNPPISNATLDDAEFMEVGVQYGFPTTDRWNEGGSTKKKPTVSPSKAPPHQAIWGVDIQNTDHLTASERSFDRTTAGSDRSQYLSTFKRDTSADDRPGRWVTGIHGRVSPSDVTIDGAEDGYDTRRFEGSSEARRLDESEGLVGRGVAPPMNFNKDTEMSDMAALFINLSPEQLADSAVRERFLTRRADLPPSVKPSDTFATSRIAESRNSKPSSGSTSRPVFQHQPVSDSSLVIHRAAQRAPTQAQGLVRTSDIDVRSGAARQMDKLENTAEYRHTELIGRSGPQANYPPQTGPIYSEVIRGGDRVVRGAGGERTSAGGHSADRGHWTCRRCTLVNDPLSIECGACGGSKAIKLSQ